MKMPESIPKNLLAPCGLDCMLCHHHCKSDIICGGCRGGNGLSKHCASCDILACTEGKGLTFCYECEDFPCKKLTDFNEVYIRRFGHEFLPNAVMMKEIGIEKASRALNEEWKCECGGIICIHDDLCSECRKKRQN